jgi:poly(A) polymerase
MVAVASSIVERSCPAPVGDARFQAVSRVIERLETAGFATYLVGGCVRDMAIGRSAKDFDVATAATPEEIEALFAKTISVGKAFGVMQVASQGSYFEVATFRKDLEYQDGRRPEGVTFCGAEEDVHRRDFRVNGLLYDVRRAVIVDYVEGLVDLDAGLIQAIGDPSERFQEDHLRLLRALRFSVQLGFRIDPGTWASICAHSDSLKKISRERVRDELIKMLESPAPSMAFEMLAKSGCLPHVLPAKLFQSGDFALDQVQHRIEDLCDLELQNRALTLLSAVLCELVTSSTCDWNDLYESDGSRKGFAHHLRDLEDCVSQLRLSRSEEHSLMGAIAVAAFLVHNCDDAHPDHVWLRLARWPGATDGFALARLLSDSENVSIISKRFGLLDENEHSPKQLLNGQDLQTLEIVPGPIFKEILRAVEDAQLDGVISDRKEALELAQELAARTTF